MVREGAERGHMVRERERGKEREEETSIGRFLSSFLLLLCAAVQGEAGVLGPNTSSQGPLCRQEIDALSLAGVRK